MLVVSLIVVLVALAATVAVRRRSADDPTYRVRLVVQAMPPCNLDVLVPVNVDERYPPSRAGEPPLTASLFGREATEWDSAIGDLRIVSGDGPVDYATFVADDGRSLEISRPQEIPALARPTDHC